MNDDRCVIVSGGARGPIPRESCGCVIACDRGLAYCLESGVVPDVFVGDFDSYSGEVPAGTELIRLPTRKDDTDTGFAVRLAIERGFSRIVLVCALGGRLDHALANLQTCADAAMRGAEVSILADDTEVFFLAGGGMLRLPKRDGWSLSVLAATDRASGVTITGCRYPLSDAVLTSRFPLGVSNEQTAPEASIRVAEGVLMVVRASLLHERA